ncbi:MAG: LytTR family transcriptional regulator DNA-binding domain-containing protein [Bacteroidetes bacterium]|nr:LytTR family transcriptional regulator DNA-binding domain-containing protein [Bacteroidota bacterium]
MKTLKESPPGWKGHPAFDQIVRIEAVENYSRLIDNQGRILVFARTLGKYENALNLPFFRVNRSCIINLSYVKAAGGTLELQDGFQVNISRRRKEHVFKALQEIR